MAELAIGRYATNQRIRLWHERSRSGEFPVSSRFPAAFRDGGIARIDIERLPSSLSQVRFGQAASELIRSSGGTGCAVLDEFAGARPVYRCQLQVSDEIEDALLIDTCIAWPKDDGTLSEVKRVYSRTEEGKVEGIDKIIRAFLAIE